MGVWGGGGVQHVQQAAVTHRLCLRKGQAADLAELRTAD